MEQAVLIRVIGASLKILGDPVSLKAETTTKTESVSFGSTQLLLHVSSNLP